KRGFPRRLLTSTGSRFETLISRPSSSFILLLPRLEAARSENDDSPGEAAALRSVFRRWQVNLVRAVRHDPLSTAASPDFGIGMWSWAIRLKASPMMMDKKA
ncbi:MAG: hypothetical protein J2P13_03215, partial [Acidobacteria bacterium]|nr:hypothetical protein [Acidobacteriota bacterium]